MMRTILVVLTLLLGLTNAAHAQRRITVYAHTGLSAPTFPTAFKDFYKTGIPLSIGIGLPLSRRTAFRLSGHFSRHRLDKAGLKEEFEEFEVPDVAFDGGTYSWFGLTADLTYAIYARSRVGPYALFGLGLFNSSADDLTVIEPEGTSTRAGRDERVLGINGGLGFYIPVSPALRIVIEPRYTVLLTNDQLLFTTDESRHFLQLRAGIALK